MREAAEDIQGSGEDCGRGFVIALVLMTRKLDERVDIMLLLVRGGRCGFSRLSSPSSCLAAVT
jgi:hypothetical protein